MNRVRLVSGSNEKGPACVLVDAGTQRLLLDLGYGPDPGRRPDLAGIGAVDALLLSHGHRDHTGSLALASEVGNPPLWCTAPVAAMLPANTTPAVHALQLTGECEVAGIRVRTGRNGHAPGGVWLHLTLPGGDLLYTGDCSVESPVYAFDPPPLATVAVVDASYGDYDTPLGDAVQALVDRLGPAPDALLPVPPGGRGPEIAWWLATRCRLPVQLGDDLRAAIDRLCGEAHASVKPEVLDALAGLARHAPPLSDAPGVRLTGSADGSSGDSATWIARLADRRSVTLVFTGYLPPGTPAQQLTAQGRAHYLRWNVHPRRRDVVDLARQTGVHQLLPAFGGHAQMAQMRKAIAPAALVLAPSFEWGAR